VCIRGGVGGVIVIVGVLLSLVGGLVFSVLLSLSSLSPSPVWVAVGPLGEGVLGRDIGLDMDENS